MHFIREFFLNNDGQIVTNLMQHSPYIRNCSPSVERCVIHKIPHITPLLRYTNPVHDISPSFFKIHFNIIPLSNA